MEIGERYVCYGCGLKPTADRSKTARITIREEHGTQVAKCGLGYDDCTTAIGITLSLNLEKRLPKN